MMQTLVVFVYVIRWSMIISVSANDNLTEISSSSGIASQTGQYQII